MNYTVIARRWRPKRFEEVIGQPHVVTTLRNAMRSGRVAHAYLFSGPRGCGKTSIARILAKAVNCAHAVDGEPCNSCDSCVAIDGGSFVDVIEIDAATNTGIDNIRELRETVKYLPMEGKYKVYIIDEAHRLSKAAFDGLLKTLEEPAGHNIFILATTEPQNMPYTVQSRCQRFDYRRIRESEMIEQLKRICDAEGVQYEERIFAYIVREADGSLRDAESVLDQIIAYSGTSVTEKGVIEVIGVVERELTFGIMKAVVEGDPKRGLEIIEEALEQGHDVYQIYRGLVLLLRDMLMIKLWKGKPPFLIIDDAEAKRLLDLMGPLEYFEVQNMLNHLLQTEDLVRGIFPKVALEILFINLYNLTRLRDVEKIIEHLEPARSGARETKTPAAVERQAPERPSPRIQPPERRSTTPPAPERTSPAHRTQERTPPANRPPEGAATVPLSPQTPDGTVRDVRAFLTYLKEKEPFIGGMFDSMDVTAEGDNIVVLLDKNHSLLRKDADVTSEVKNKATEFFGRQMGLVFKDSEGPKASTLDDYVKEAEVLFKA